MVEHGTFERSTVASSALSSKVVSDAMSSSDGGRHHRERAMATNEFAESKIDESWRRKMSVSKKYPAKYLQNIIK